MCVFRLSLFRLKVLRPYCQRPASVRDVAQTGKISPDLERDTNHLTACLHACLACTSVFENVARYICRRVNPTQSGAGETVATTSSSSSPPPPTDAMLRIEDAAISPAGGDCDALTHRRQLHRHFGTTPSPPFFCEAACLVAVLSCA